MGVREEREKREKSDRQCKRNMQVADREQEMGLWRITSEGPREERVDGRRD
jgi:hypothetical protein